jgi:periplasmic protein CpxP/Spy
MKKMSLLLLAACITAATLNAQPGGSQRRTVEERVKIVQAKLDSAFKLDPAKIAQVDTVFANYYRSSDKTREELMAGGGQRPDFSVMREKMQPLMDARDKELKALLTEDQFKTWKEQIEPAMRPQRGARN